MQVNLLTNYDEGMESLVIPYNSLREILSYLKFIKGQEVIDEILNNKYTYLVQKLGEDPIPLLEEVILSDLSAYDSIFILKVVEGEDPFSVGAALFATFDILGGVSVTTFTVASYIAGSAILLAGSIGLQYLMNALSPTPHTSDPVQAQTSVSNLFNGARIINEQGGVVPLAYGECFAGGTLISSSVTTIQG